MYLLDSAYYLVLHELQLVQRKAHSIVLVVHNHILQSEGELVHQDVFLNHVFRALVELRVALPLGRGVAGVGALGGVVLDEVGLEGSCGG